MNYEFQPPKVGRGGVAELANSKGLLVDKEGAGYIVWRGNTGDTVDEFKFDFTWGFEREFKTVAAIKKWLKALTPAKLKSEIFRFQGIGEKRRTKRQPKKTRAK